MCFTYQFLVAYCSFESPQLSLIVLNNRMKKRSSFCVGVVSTDGKFELANTTLETNEVLLEQGLLLLDGTDLVLQFHVFNLLQTKVLLQVIFNSTR